MAEAAHVAPHEIHVWLGPSIAQCSYEVGAELTDVFDAEHLRLREHGKYELDVAAAVVADLLRAGSAIENIRRNTVDTYASQACYSYRRDGVRTGRMLSYVRLK